MVNVRFRPQGKSKVYSFLNKMAGSLEYHTGKSCYLKTDKFDFHRSYKRYKDTVVLWLSEHLLLYSGRTERYF